MKNTKLFLTVLSLLALLVSNAIGAAWTGSMSEPENMKKIDGKAFYVITTADELAWFAAQVNNGKTTINAVLGNDIVFGASNNATSTSKWTPIGNSTKRQFSGILDGSGHTIYGLYTSDISLAGLVGDLGVDGIVRNLNTASGNISGVYRVGGIVAHNEGLISGVTNRNNVNATNSSGNAQVFAGGIVAHNNGTIVNCNNSGSISGKAESDYLDPDARFGGIAGYNTGIVEKGNNSGSVLAKAFNKDRYSKRENAKAYSGGVVGYNESTVNMCKNSGKISVDSKCANTYGKSDPAYAYYGGVVGYTSTMISNCINSGSLSAEVTEFTYYYYGGSIVATGKAKNSYDTVKKKYWLNGVEVQGTAENMQKDQFAWILNTTNGTTTNDGVWSRNGGYPIFADELNHAIYKVTFNDEGVTSNRYTNNKGIANFPEDPEPAEGFIFMGWYNADDTRVKSTTVFSADQTVNAVYTDASDVFWKITFYNAAPADTVLESKSYQHGSVVAYGGATPTLASTAQYTYTFKGWDVEPTNAVEDFDYHAVYDSTIRSYTVTFNNTDGSKIESATFEYGKMPSCSKTPTRATTAEWKYSHKGWRPALDYVTEAATYTAIYDSSKVEYKVTFMNGTTVIDEQMVPYGDAAVAPTNVTREGYKFVGWNTSFAKVTEALTVKALFEELIVRTVSVVNSDGEKIDNVKVEDGESYTLPEAPKKDGYTFDAYYDGDKKLGVAGDEISVTANITIIAKYIDNPKSSSSSTPKSSSSIKSSSSAKSSSSVVKSSSSSSKKVSSSSGKSSSSQAKSSSSKKSNAVVSKVQTPKFSLQVQARSIQISAVPMNSVYAIFDMQGRVLKNGRVSAANFNIALPRAGSYLVKIGNQTRKVNIR